MLVIVKVYLDHRIIHFYDNELNYPIKMEFDNEEASKTAFQLIWESFAMYGFCDLDKFSLKTGMVMR